jgi:hypothetical protein
VLDYRHISESIAEIRKRASRLRENLMLPATKDNEKSLKRSAATTTGQVKDSLLMLDNLIMSFVRNPLFQQPGVVDAKHSAKAGSAMKTIIEFSGDIRKEIELLSKVTGKQ